MEAELIALVSTSEEANQLRDLLYEIPLWEKLSPPILIHYDSTAAKPLQQWKIQTYKKKAQCRAILFEWWHHNCGLY